MAESGNSPKNSTNGMPNWLRGPVLWVVLTGILAGAAVVLHMSGPAYSVHALTVTALALAALAFLAWTLGASGADDPAARMLRSAADDAPDGLLIVAGDGSFVYINPAFHRLFYMAAAAGSGGQVESLDAIGRALGGDEAVTAFQRLKSNAETGVGGRA